ncbi:prohead protease/major capsid protein fusion protein [Rhodobacter capsulatus]|uniref:prohead protease/major capsid protein fusion protein n=1 Tax=Rhodobacter capsulatus TaxID=1061 RepID=UPI0003D2C6CB|nr:prohead protease/major capsid protein fusion protein [Rhodobacter capsulatus]ETD90881.1 peptidase U35 [Rhodobacter capsulatus YW2]
MPNETRNLPLITREASLRLVRGEGDDMTIDVIWTTGAIVQRRRYEGWDDVVEYDEELVVTPGAVRMDRLNAGAPFLDSHRSWGLESVVGAVLPGTARIEGGQGFARVRLTSAPDAAPIVQRIMDGTVSAVSVGYRVHRYDITKAKGQRELWRAVDWEPMEISAVAMPADPGAHIRSTDPRPETLTPCLLTRADAPAPSPNQTRTTMPETQTPEADANVESRAAPITPPAADPSPDAIRTEANRSAAEVLALCERHALGAGFAADLIRRGLSLDAARAAILDKLAEADAPAARGSEPVAATARGTGAADAAYRDAMSEALLHRHNPGRAQLTDRAREFRGLTLLELARHALDQRGIATRGMSKMELATEALIGRSGLHSTSDFPLILANVANKTLRAAYDTTPRTFTAWARQAVITDFKPVARNQLGGAPDLLRVPESGEFTYGTIGESREVYALVTYGRIVGITRQTLINDDLDAFTRIPSAFGAAAADLESDLVYSIFSTNPNMADGNPLFHASHANLGTAGAISETTLAEAYRLFGNQRGLEGRQISVLPRYIITPPGVRSVEARKNVTATTPNAVAGVNAFANRLEPIEEARLIPAAGPDPWFLAADPSRIDTIEFAYLEGQQGVYTETRSGFEVDGIEIKARHDFAAKAIDWRGLFRNAGV